MMAGFLEGFRVGLPAMVSFEAFGELVQSTCLNSSQLRMKISGTEIMGTSRKLAVSQASTVILSYFTTSEKLQGQMVCRKWYNRFVPQVMQTTVKLNLPVSHFVGKRFKLAYYPEDQHKEQKTSEEPLYLAVITD